MSGTQPVKDTVRSVSGDNTTGLNPALYVEVKLSIKATLSGQAGLTVQEALDGLSEEEKAKTYTVTVDGNTNVKVTSNSNTKYTDAITSATFKTVDFNNGVIADKITFYVSLNGGTSSANSGITSTTGTYTVTSTITSTAVGG